MAKFRMRVCVDYNDDGTPVFKRLTANSETEMSDKIVRAILASPRRSEFMDDAPDISSTTFKEYAEEWLTTYKRGRIKPTTLGGYLTILESHLYPSFGTALLREIRVKDIQQMLNDRSDRAEKTLREILQLLRTILESAKLDGLISVNPASDPRIRVPSTRVGMRNALSTDEIRSVIDQLDSVDNADDRRFLALVIFTGMRRGEALGCRWEDLDLESMELHVRRNVTFPRGQNQPVVGTTKTKSGVRDIPITDSLIHYLEPIGVTGYIVGGEKVNTLSIVRRRKERLEKAIDLHGATPHIFRHSYATMLYESGADIKTIQSIIGQSDFKTTADRYCHPRDSRKKTAVRALEKMVGVDANLDAAKN